MTTTEQQATIEYALMIDWEDGHTAEYIPARSLTHAETMAHTIYRGRRCWTVGREVQPWRYAHSEPGYLSEPVDD